MAIFEDHMVRIILYTVGIVLTDFKGINFKNLMDYMRKSTKFCLSYLEDTHAD